MGGAPLQGGAGKKEERTKLPWKLVTCHWLSSNSHLLSSSPAQIKVL